MAKINQVNPKAPSGMASPRTDPYFEERLRKERALMTTPEEKPQLVFPSLEAQAEEPFTLPEETEGEEVRVPWWKNPAQTLGKGLEAIGIPFVWANEHLDKPWAALLVLAGQGLVPGTQDIEKALEERKVGDSWVDTIKGAYDEMELPWGAKTMLEFTMPLWWVFPSAYIAKAVGVGMKGAKAIGLTRFTSKVVKNLLSAPLIKKALVESVGSKIINAPFRVNGVMQDMGKAYQILNLKPKDLLSHIMRGSLEPGVVSKLKHFSAYKPGARKLEVLDIMMSDKTFKSMVQRELPDLAEQLAKGLKSSDDVIAYLGGTMQKVMAAKAGVEMPKATSNIYGQAMAYWKAGVLTTPWYVAQNYFENFFRTSISTFEPWKFGGFETAFPLGKVHIPQFRNLWSTVKGRPMPDELLNTALTLGARLDGKSTVVQLRTAVNASLKQAEIILKKTKNPVTRRSLEASIFKYQDMLERMPHINERLKVAPAQLSGEAIMRGAIPATTEHPFTKGNRLFLEKAVFKPEFEAEVAVVRALKGKDAAKAWRKRWVGRQEKLTHAVNVSSNYPRSAAAMSDSGGKISCYNALFDNHMDASMHLMPNRVAFLDEVLDTATLTKLKALGFTKKELKSLRIGLRDSKVSNDIKLAVANISESPLPHISNMPDECVIPTSVWNAHQVDMQAAILKGDKKAIRAIGKQIKGESWAHTADMKVTYENMLKEFQGIGVEKFPVLKSTLDDIDDLYSNMALKMKAFDDEEIATFGAEFMVKEIESRKFFETQLYYNRATTKVIEGKYMQQQLTKGVKAADISQEVHGVVKLGMNKTMQFADEYRKSTRSINSFFNTHPGKKNEAIRLAQWKEWYKKQLVTRPSLVRGLSKNKPDIEMLWNQERLSVSELYRDFNETIAKTFGVEMVSSRYHPSTWLANAYSDADDLVARATIALDDDVPKLVDKFMAIDVVEKKALKLLKKNQAGLLDEWFVQTQAMNFASGAADGIMGNYAVTTDLDTFMNKISPFWYFPSRSIPYYLKTFAQKPYLLAHLERYLQGSLGDDVVPKSLVGYLPIHAGDQYYFINALRPWMGYQLLGYEPMAGLGQPFIQQLGQMVNMMGVGLHPGLSYGLEMINRISSAQGFYLTRGEPMSLFPQEKWLQDVIGLTGVWQPTVGQLLFNQNADNKPDWETRNLEKEVARWMGQEQNAPMLQEKGWEYPRDVLKAAETDNDARDIVKSQIARMSRFGLMSVALPIYSRRNEEEIERFKNKDEFLKELMVDNGIDPEEAFKRANEVGFSPMMYLNKLQRREIYKAHPEWKPWDGLTRVGISPEEKEMERQTREFYIVYDREINIATQRMEVLDQAFLGGFISAYNWRKSYSDTQNNMSAVWMTLIGDGYAPGVTRNGGMLPLARVTTDRVEYFREKYQQPIPPILPEDSALDYYYSIQPELEASTGQYDYDTYFAKRESFLSSMPPYVQKYIADYRRLSKYDSLVEEEFRKDKEKLQTYFSVRRNVKDEFPEFAAILAQLEREQDPEAIIALNKRKNAFERIVSERKEQLRLHSAEVESLLFKWGYIDTFVNLQTIAWLTK